MLHRIEGLPWDCVPALSKTKRAGKMTLQYQEKCIGWYGSHFRRDLKIIGEKTVENWWRKEGHRVDAGDLTDILAANPICV